MIPNGLFRQLLIIPVVLGIVFYYIEPTFSEISKTQDLVASYQEEREKVVSVNSRLQTLVTDRESISDDDERRLLTYMPDDIDEIAVQKDIKRIADISGVIYQGVTVGATRQEANTDSSETETIDKTEPYSFALSVQGTYAQLKQLLQLIESNNYPLQIDTLSLDQSEGGFLTADMTLVTYALQSEVGEGENNEFEF